MNFQQKMDEGDEKIKAMEVKLGESWQTAVLEIVNAPCAHALDRIWKDLFPDEYGEWEYPGQAYRHIMAEIDHLRKQRDGWKQIANAYARMVDEQIEKMDSLAGLLGIGPSSVNVVPHIVDAYEKMKEMEIERFGPQEENDG